MVMREWLQFICILSAALFGGSSTVAADDLPEIVTLCQFKDRCPTLNDSTVQPPLACGCQTIQQGAWTYWSMPCADPDHPYYPPHAPQVYWSVDTGIVVAKDYDWDMDLAGKVSYDLPSGRCVTLPGQEVFPSQFQYEDVHVTASWSWMQVEIVDLDTVAQDVVYWCASSVFLLLLLIYNYVSFYKDQFHAHADDDEMLEAADGRLSRALLDTEDADADGKSNNRSSRGSHNSSGKCRSCLSYYGLFRSMVAIFMVVLTVLFVIVSLANSKQAFAAMLTAVPFEYSSTLLLSVDTLFLLPLFVFSPAIKCKTGRSYDATHWYIGQALGGSLAVVIFAIRYDVLSYSVSCLLGAEPEYTFELACSSADSLLAVPAVFGYPVFLCTGLRQWVARQYFHTVLTMKQLSQQNVDTIRTTRLFRRAVEHNINYVCVSQLLSFVFIVVLCLHVDTLTMANDKGIDRDSIQYMVEEYFFHVSFMLIVVAVAPGIVVSHKTVTLVNAARDIVLTAPSDKALPRKELRLLLSADSLHAKLLGVVSLRTALVASVFVTVGAHLLDYMYTRYEYAH